MFSSKLGSSDKDTVVSTSMVAADHDLPDLKGDVVQEREVFSDAEGAISYRTIGWIQASTIFLKIIFATGVLSIPSSMVVMGAVPGALLIIGAQALNTYGAILYGRFKLAHPSVHGATDVAMIIGGKWAAWIITLLYQCAMIFCASSAIIGGVAGLNEFTGHRYCTVALEIPLFVAVCATASIPKLHHVSWVTWTGSLSIFVAVLICVIGVTQLERPAGAPDGAYELGYSVFPSSAPSFVDGMAAWLTIFCSSSGTGAFIPVIAEMKRPQDYRKAVYTCMGFVLCCYLCFALVIFKWCGQYVAAPALTSAGSLLAKVSYGVGMWGFIAAGTVFVHICAKFVFVQALRNTRHLQEKTWTHWIVWFTSVWGIGSLSFIFGNIVPFYAYIFAILAAFCWSHIAITLPAAGHIYDHRSDRNGTWYQRCEYYLCCFMILLGFFMFFGGTYASIMVIIRAYARGDVTGVFACDA